ncbi:hypothetical protein EUGRSUZ_C00539 [Eucalyptus grandis]|uniref:Uncharacterized protein n=2 Tax=Eucalyptus grandis TaxID=71139 RepID=A0ACC3LAB0_EUCGR|nr:hypothetical protein EUGRSUZ_C00539 [Eucalyptus grandis]
MKCKETRGQIVLPVLYKVKPYEVRELKGAFGKAYKSCKDKFEEDVKQQGLLALKKAVGLRVFEPEKFADGREGELVNELIEIILLDQRQDFQPHLPEKLVAIEDRVAEVMELVDLACPETRIIGIWGMGGIGKTTLATIIYKKLFDKFQCRSSLKDIRETIKMEGIKHVQSLLISDIKKSPPHSVHNSDIVISPPHSVHNSDIGIAMIRLSCENKKVLILLDDVDHQEHLDNLIGGCTFGLGSRIIITCRNKALLKSEYNMYELKEMNHKESLLLFSRYAFEGEHPPKDLATLSSDIVATTGGLPLALMVVGSLLKGEKDQMIWAERLEKLRKVPHEDVREKLKISYDTLGHAEKEMFLDIACFFIGTDKRIATYLWEDLKLLPRTGLQILINHSLIKIDEENRLRMHNQLRNLGRAIACPADKKPWACSRLWDKKAMAVLRSEENEYIEALCLDKNGSSKFMEQKSFKRLPKLKFLHMERLKVLNLSSCSILKTTPKLSAFKSLEMLILEYCPNLEEIDSSVGDVKSLVSLNLRYCGSLKKLPAELGRLEELEELLIDETDITEIPSWIGSLKKLKMLSAVGCGSLTRIHSSISCLVNLSTLNLTTCKNLQELCSFNALGELRRLYLVGCYRLKQITFSIGKLEKLVELDMSYTRIKLLPESIANLENLKILRISHSEIEKLPSTIGKLESLQELDASGCHKLEGKILGDIGGLSSLRTLHLGKAKISHLPENFCELSSLNHLDLLYCSKLESLPYPPSGLSSLQLTCQSNTLPSLSHLSRLKKLTLHCCMFLESIPQLPSNIRKLCVWKCPKLKTLPNLSNLRSLMELELLQCYGLMQFNGLEALESLTKLDVSTSPELPNLNDFEDLELWTNLDLQSYDGEVDNLLELRGISHLKSLEVLNISARKRIRQLDLSKSEHLKQLIVNNCESLVEIRCHDKIESLEHFDRNGCKSLTILPDFLAYDRS